MIDESEARLKLFVSICPADPFWSYEVASRGAAAVYEEILGGSTYIKHKDLSWLQNDLLSLDTSKLLNEISTAKAEFISPCDLDWPNGLDDLSAPPIGLLIRGNRSSLFDLTNSISIVGTRKPSQYGVEVTEEFAKGATSRTYAVVSGGAFGIDTASHISTLENSGITCSVLGGGFNQIYPKENAKLFSKIEEDGLLISEVMPNVSAKPYRFLIRNRLIAALSKATLVIEAAYVSGSIRTARDAAEIFRPVFAVPGPITSPLSDGCHRLIAERVADIATSVDEILEVVTPLHLR
ncbi:MAG: DNA-processing protein DprA [Actinomycetes bacterium]|jgi:DNA processing protein